ncbi:MAG: hypothetical protein ACYC6A_00780 [Armatimonadota bacterium]
MATLAVQVVNTTGVVPSYNAAAELGDEFVNNGKTFIHVKNGGAAPITVTVAAQNACSLAVLHDVAVVIANAAEKMIGPFSRTVYNDGDGNAQLTYSDHTSVTVAVLSNPDA